MKGQKAHSSSGRASATWPPKAKVPRATGQAPYRAVLAGMAVLGVMMVGLLWWLGGDRGEDVLPEPDAPGAPAKSMPKEAAKPMPQPAAKPSVPEKAAAVPTYREKVVMTPQGEKRAKVGYTRAVQAALRSSNEPIQSFVKPVDPNAPPPPPPRYRNLLQSQLSEFAWSGQFVGVPDPMTDKEARQMLEEPIEILASDTEEVVAEKQTVMALQKELKEYLDNGGHADDYFMELMKRQDAEAETVREAKSQIRDLYKSGDVEPGDQVLVKFNEYLKGKGLPAIKETPLMKRYRRQAAEKTAQEKQ